MRVGLDPEAQRLLERLPSLVAPGDAPAQLVTVFATAGSAPRAVGARLLCRDGVLLAGTIGGGSLEGRAIAEAGRLQREAVAAGLPLAPPRLARFALGPELAQCCGGTVELLYEGIDARGARTRADALREALRLGTELSTTCEGRTLRESADALPTVVIFGAGHVGAALAGVLRALPWRVVVIDARAALCDPARLPAGVEALCAEPVAVLAAWGWMGAGPARSQLALKLGPLPPAPAGELQAAVVMTHDHDLDREIAAVLLQLPEVAGREALTYTGLIGSQTKIAALKRRLTGRGMSETQLARLTAPIGLRVGGRPLGGKRPGEIAISVAAELLHVFTAPTPEEAEIAALQRGRP